MLLRQFNLLVAFVESRVGGKQLLVRFLPYRPINIGFVLLRDGHETLEVLKVGSYLFKLFMHHVYFVLQRLPVKHILVLSAGLLSQFADLGFVLVLSDFLGLFLFKRRGRR